VNAVTLDEARRSLEQLIEQVNADAEPTIILAESGQRGVLISFAEFNSWQETLYLLASPANAAHLRRSIAQINQ
jgi:antitoxin YefM